MRPKWATLAVLTLGTAATAFAQQPSGPGNSSLYLHDNPDCARNPPKYPVIINIINTIMNIIIININSSNNKKNKPTSSPLTPDRSYLAS
ncbi:LOW QUALITY PROTEIN: hypothetical protein CH63R_12586 [Colletotrichum higginsianum IMI 349063]|uniref:Uncharacterized protein n=1 Tax=Colletotrichum higginsianum (strain IMI 349063) TaxID=759273 RepID=A0A1B7XUM1_COLHI|nr:LOW QUALITY PROTEIN: hypothetical protein CH63R_12586 [Colletotrichum higginsianum IMI 349063]OBR03459.1 LOW QUALITY PROTEIN: hypothetical protein CH63R_12586 [Colletotrichum higginsianum IMI 349063]